MSTEPVLPPVEPLPSPKPPLIRRVFVGKEGLRAGWGLLIFLLLFAAILLPIIFAIGKAFPSVVKLPKPGSEIHPSFGIVNDVIPFLVALLVAWIMSKIERRPNSVYGLGGSRRISLFLAGLAWGVAFLSLLVFALWRTGLLAFDQRLLFGGDILRYGVVWLVLFLFVGLLEEYLVRGYILYTLTRGLAAIYERVFKTQYSRALGFWTSAIALSILFGLGHGSNPGESPIGLLTAGLAALVFCFSLWRTGSLWWAIGFHAAWDWSQSYLYGVADSGLITQHHLFATHPVGKPILSGGTTGPEGSILILAIFLFISLVIAFTLRRDPKPRA